MYSFYFEVVRAREAKLAFQRARFAARASVAEGKQTNAACCPPNESAEILSPSIFFVLAKGTAVMASDWSWPRPSWPRSPYPHTYAARSGDGAARASPGDDGDGVGHPGDVPERGMRLVAARVDGRQPQSPVRASSARVHVSARREHDGVVLASVAGDEFSPAQFVDAFGEVHQLARRGHVEVVRNAELAVRVETPPENLAPRPIHRRGDREAVVTPRPDARHAGRQIRHFRRFSGVSSSPPRRAC